MTTTFGLDLPDYPWDRLTEFRRRAGEHPDGVCDLSIGTPVDPTPEVIRRALSEAGDAHGYPTTAGTAELREAIADWRSEERRVGEASGAGRGRKAREQSGGDRRGR